MCTSRLLTILLAVGLVGAPGASAALAPGTRLSFTDGPVGEFVAPPAGSWFAIGSTYVGLQKGPDGGIVLGAAQPASGSHAGSPDGSEAPSIDAPWSLLGETGMHFTTSPVVDNDDGTADLSGWGVTWFGMEYDVGGGSPAALVSDGSTFALDYSFDSCPECFGAGNTYVLHLEGDVLVVPEPASLALVGGLLPVVLARRRGRASPWGRGRSLAR